MDELEKIENYLNGSLNQEDKMNFEKEMGQNPALTETLNKFSLVKDAILSAGIRKEVAEVHQKFMAERSVESRNIAQKPLGRQVFMSGNFLKIAASVLLVCSLFAVYQFSSLNSESILADAQIDYMPSTLRGEESHLEGIRNMYRNQNFEAVILQLRKESKPNPEMVFLKAMSNFKLKNYQISLNDFEQLKNINAQSSKPSFVYEIEYYESLALVGNKNYDLAIEKLEKIKLDSQNPYHSAISSWDIFKLNILK